MSINLNTGARLVIMGMIVSLILAAIKFVVGIAGHSYALVADGLESSTDVISSFVIMLGISYASKPPDKEHPFGHGRFETLISFVTILFLLGTAVVIAYNSIRNILTPHELPKLYTIYVLAAVILIKEILYRIIRKRNKTLNSPALEAEAQHHRSDAITSLSAFAGIIVAVMLGKGYEAADDWAALIAALVIVYNCYRISQPAYRELMDEQNHTILYHDVAMLARSVPGVIDTEKCFIRKAGMNFLVDLHIEVNADMTVRDSHDIAHLVEEKLLRSDLRIVYVAIHVEPHDNIKRQPNYLT